MTIIMGVMMTTIMSIIIIVITVRALSSMNAIRLSIVSSGVLPLQVRIVMDGWMEW